MRVSVWELAGVFAFGTMVGSFLNVCIWRIPAEEQVVKGRSHCRSCGKTIAAYDNIPLVSWVLLGGKCRQCKARISWVYPFVELANGLLFAGIVARFGWSWEALVYAVLAAALLMVSMIDLAEMILPDEVTLPGIAVGLIVSFLLPQLHGELLPWKGLVAGLIGAAAGGGFLWAVGGLGSWLFKKEAMGFGDVKLMAMVGAFIGLWKVLLVNMILAPVLGAVVGVALKVRTGKEVIPFGPFLAIGTLLAIFWGDPVIAWYTSLLTGG